MKIQRQQPIGRTTDTCFRTSLLVMSLSWLIMSCLLVEARLRSHSSSRVLLAGVCLGLP